MSIHKRKTNGKWYAQLSYKDENGKYRKKSTKDFKTKRQAQEEFIKLKQKIKNGEIRTSNNGLTFQQAYEEFKTSQMLKVKASTINNYPSIWKHFTLNNLQIEKLTVPQYQKFKQELLDSGLSIDRCDSVHRLVRQVVDYATKMYDIKNNVVQRVGGFKDTTRIRKEKINFYTYDEFKEFIASVDKLKYKALFTFLYFEGARIGEANALTWNDINFNNKQIYINKTINKLKNIPYVPSSTKKTSSDRVIPLFPEVEKLLLELQKEMKTYKNYSDSWYVFGGVLPISRENIRSAKNKYADKSNLKRIRIHDFRHSSASFYISELNCQPSEIQALLGHSSLQITLNTYNHLYPNKLQGITEKIKNYCK